MMVTSTDNREVAGSNPVRSRSSGVVSSIGRAPPCQGGCCGFESRLSLQYMQVSYIGNTPAFQAEKVGSIPTTCSLRFIENL